MRFVHALVLQNVVSIALVDPITASQHRLPFDCKISTQILQTPKRMFVPCGLIQSLHEIDRFSKKSVALVICEMLMQQLEIFGFLDGMDMSRAFRAGVEKHRRIKAPTRQRRWQPLRDLAGLEARTKTIEQTMGPLVDVPALVRIEDEKWVFERVDEQTLHQLTHRLVLHEEEGTRTIGATVNLASAMHVAKRMAEQEQKIVLIRPM